MTRSIILILSLLMAPLRAQEPAKGVVEGTVVDEVTGEPVRRAWVQLTGQREGKMLDPVWVQPQADGRFLFQGLESGTTYYVMARKSGYVDRGETIKVQLAPAERKTGLVVKLTPQGIISGRIFDEDGDPVQGAQVEALQRRKVAGKFRGQAGMSSGTTNDRGEYRLAGLGAGEFYVSASYRDPATPRRAGAQAQVYATTYYPNGIDVNTAQVVTAQKGGDTAGIDLRLRKEAAFRVLVKVEGVSAELLRQTSINLMPRDPSGGFGRMGFPTRLVEPGLYELTGVRAGSWVVQAQVHQQGGAPLIGITPIEVASADVADVVVRVGEGQQITGSFVLEGTPVVKMNWKNHHVRLVPADGVSYFGVGSGQPLVTEDGAFTMRNSMPGRYLLDVQGPRPEKTYVASIKVGNEEYFGKELDLTGGAPGPIKVIYRNDAATVSGKLEGEAGGTPGQSGLAVLVPVEAHLRRMEYMAAASIKPDGSFVFAAVRPGEYLVCHMAGDHRALAEEGEPPKDSMEAAVRLKVERNGTHTVTLKR